MTDTAQDPKEPPRDSLVRAWAGDEAISLRDSGDGAAAPKVFGYFARFNEWTEINSSYEGHFLERVAPTAFDRTISERSNQIRVLYDHGKDPSIGNKPLGVTTVLEPRSNGGYYEFDPFTDAAYVRDLFPAIRAGQLGTSFRFSVPEDGDAWERPMRATAWNPDQLPERTVTDVDLFEYGPVTFPAYPGATAGMRSATDDYVAHVLRDPLFVARFTEQRGLAVAEKMIATIGRASMPDDMTFSDISEKVEDAIEDAIGVDDETSDVWISDLTTTWAVYEVIGPMGSDLDGGLFKITYTIDADGTVTLTSDPQPVETAYVPREDAADGRSRKIAQLTRAAADGPTLDQRQRWLASRSLLRKDPA